MKSDRQKINALAIRLQGTPVGIINRLAGDRHIFSFEQDYIDNPQRPMLSLSFKGQAGGLVTSPRSVTVRLPPFFSNVLPEGHLRTYLAQRADVKPEREFFLLEALGADLPGALTATALETDEHAGEYPTEADDNQKDPTLHFSLAGIQLKFSAIMEASGGLTVPANGMGGSVSGSMLTRPSLLSLFRGNIGSRYTIPFTFDSHSASGKAARATAFLKSVAALNTRPGTYISCTQCTGH